MALYPGTTAGNTDLINGWGLAASDYPPGDITPWLSGRDPNQTPTGPIIPPFELPPWPSGTTAPSAGRTLPPLQQPVPPAPTIGQVGATDPLGRARGAQLPPLAAQGPSTISQIGSLANTIGKTIGQAKSSGGGAGRGGGGSTYASAGRTGQAPSGPTVPYRSMTMPVPAQVNFPQPRPAPVFLGAFQQGGIVPQTGLYPVQGGEHIIPKKKVQKVAKLHKGELVLPRYVGSYQDGGTVPSDGTPMTPEEQATAADVYRRAAEQAKARQQAQTQQQPVNLPAGTIVEFPQNLPAGSTIGGQPANPTLMQRIGGMLGGLGAARQQATAGGGGGGQPWYTPGRVGPTQLPSPQVPQNDLQSIIRQMQGGGAGTTMPTFPTIPGGPAPGGPTNIGPSQYVIPPTPTYTDLSFMGKGSRTQARVSNAIGGLANALTMYRQRQWDQQAQKAQAVTTKKLMEEMQRQQRQEQPQSSQAAPAQAQPGMAGPGGALAQQAQALGGPTGAAPATALQGAAAQIQQATPTMTTAPQGLAGQPGAQAAMQQGIQQQAQQDPQTQKLMDLYQNEQDPKQKQQLGRLLQQRQKANERGDAEWAKMLTDAQLHPYGATYTGMMNAYKSVYGQVTAQAEMENKIAQAKAQTLDAVAKYKQAQIEEQAYGIQQEMWKDMFTDQPTQPGQQPVQPGQAPAPGAPAPGAASGQPAQTPAAVGAQTPSTGVKPTATSVQQLPGMLGRLKGPFAESVKQLFPLKPAEAAALNGALTYGASKFDMSTFQAELDKIATQRAEDERASKTTISTSWKETSPGVIEPFETTRESYVGGAGAPSAEDVRKNLPKQGPIFKNIDIYAWDPAANNGQGQEVETTPEEAYNKHWQGTRKPSPAEMTNDKFLANRLSDVARKINVYQAAMNEPISEGDRLKLAQMLGEDKIKAEFLGTSLPVDWMNELGRASLTYGLSQPALDRMYGYLNVKEAMLGYQTVLSRSARQSQMGLQLNIGVMPNPLSSDAAARTALNQFKENVPYIYQGYPKLRGVANPLDILKGGQLEGSVTLPTGQKINITSGGAQSGKAPGGGGTTGGGGAGAQSGWAQNPKTGQWNHWDSQQKKWVASPPPAWAK